MSDPAAFPGDNRIDGSEVWKEYKAIQAEADKLGTESLVRLGEGNPRDAETLATLSVSSRLEAVAYLISKAKVF